MNLSLLLHNSQLLFSQFGLGFRNFSVILFQDPLELLTLCTFFLLEGRTGGNVRKAKGYLTGQYALSFL